MWHHAKLHYAAPPLPCLTPVYPTGGDGEQRGQRPGPQAAAPDTGAPALLPQDTQRLGGHGNSRYGVVLLMIWSFKYRIESCPSGCCIVRFLELVRPCLRIFPLIVSHSFLLYFILLFYYDSCVCFLLLCHHYSSHARGIPCEKHTSCMGSSFPVVPTR